MPDIRTQLEEALCRAEAAEDVLRRQSLVMATLRGAARTLFSQCECNGTGNVRHQRGFISFKIECTSCTALREALSHGEIV